MSSAASTKTSDSTEERHNKQHDEPTQASIEPFEAEVVPQISHHGETEEVPKDEDLEYIEGWKLYIVLISLTLCTFLMMLDNSIMSTAIPRITSQFHSLGDIGWYASAYQLACASFQPLIGKIFTYFKAKAIFIGFFGLFELGSVICGAAQSSSMLIVGRAVAGLGVSGMYNGAITILAGALPMHKRPAALGVMMGFAQLGIILGPLIGGALTEYTTWRWCFFINLPIGALATVLLLLCHVPEEIKKPKPMVVLKDKNILRKFDITGAILFAGFVVMLLLALEFGGTTYSWNSSTIIGLFVGAGVILIIGLWWEYRSGDNAMIPFSLIRRRIVTTAILCNSCQFLGIYIAAYFMPIYFQAVRGATPFMSGVYLLPSIISQLICAVLSGIMIGKLGYYMPWSIFGGVLTTIGAGLVTTFSPSTSTGKWIGYQIILGAGRGCAMQTAMIAVQNAVPPKDNSMAMALMVFCQNLVSAIFLTIGNVIFDNSLESLIPQDAPSVNPEIVIAAGATGFRDVVPSAALPGVLQAYAKSFDRVLYLAVAGGAAFCLLSLGTGWKDIRKKPATTAPTQSATNNEEEKV